jgi:hypothetical protein
MNKFTRTRLKIMVERVVRPVPVSTARKGRMREELLGHVTAVFEEERARLGDDEAAFERTEQRFGNPDELTGQLLKSVPGKDFVERAMERVVVLTVVWLVLFGAGEFPLFSGRLLLDLCRFLVGLVFLADLVRRALHGPAGRSWPHAILIAAASIVLFLGLLLSSLEFFSDVWSPSNIFMLTATLTWGLVTPVHETVARLRSQLEWENLQIE